MRILRVEQNKIYVAFDNAIEKPKTISEVQSKIKDIYGMIDEIKIETFIRSIDTHDFELRQNEVLYTVIFSGI